MRPLRNVLRVYSYVFEAVLGGMGVLLSIFSLASPNVSVGLSWLPWAGPGQIKWIAGLSILGLILVALAALGIERILLFLYAGVVVYLLVRGLFINAQYAFAGPEETHNALLLVVAAFIAFIGAFPIIPRKRRT